MLNVTTTSTFHVVSAEYMCGTATRKRGDTAADRRLGENCNILLLLGELEDNSLSGQLVVD